MPRFIWMEVHFIAARFEKCTIVITGLMGCVLDDPQFNECKWTFSGPAQNTLTLLSALYRAGARDLVEATFDEVRGKAGTAMPLELGRN